MIWFSDFCFLAARANLWKDLGKKSGEIEVIRVNPSKNSYNESYNLLECPQIPPTIKSNSIPSQNTALWKINKAYLWPRSKGWMWALKASIQPAATKVTNMLYLSSRGRLLCLRQIPILLAKGYRLHTISTTSGGSKGLGGGDRIQATMVFERIE